ncbi:MAG: hypothetical protein PHE57_08245, partial [Synergistales bacterium]|nr:hypothetical protein [Synergistales bacterium]MDD5515277.1 hypothetical protein [Synergistales bacterium]
FLFSHGLYYIVPGLVFIQHQREKGVSVEDLSPENFLVEGSGVMDVKPVPVKTKKFPFLPKNSILIYKGTEKTHGLHLIGPN